MCKITSHAHWTDSDLEFSADTAATGEPARLQGEGVSPQDTERERSSDKSEESLIVHVVEEPINKQRTTRDIYQEKGEKMESVMGPEIALVMLSLLTF